MPNADTAAVRVRGGEVLPSMRTLAVMTAFNEGDVIHHAIGALIAEGVDVYLIDNCSTDDTVEQASPWLGRGLVHVETFPDDAGFSERSRHAYVWRDILTRVEQVAAGSDADWCLFVNADEFRESPYPDLDLGEAVAFVDALGYNAINFELYDFQPVDDDFVPGDDVRRHIAMYEPGQSFNTLQIKAWKASEARALLANSGGHEATFPGRRVYPIPFVLRHYGIRGETHGRRKVFAERLPRFTAEERADGWHVQYDTYASGETKFLRDPDELIAYDRDAVCAQLLARASRRHQLACALRGSNPDAPIDSTSASAWAARLLAMPAADAATALNAGIAALPTAAPGAAAAPLIVAARLLQSERETAGDLHAARRLGELLARLVPYGPGVEARSFVTVAHAAEASASPDILAAYARHFSASDDATLVLYGADDDATARLVALLAELGLDGDDAPDMLVVDRGPAARALVRRAAALVSSHPDAELSRLPRFGPERLAAVRAMAGSALAARA